MVNGRFGQKLCFLILISILLSGCVPNIRPADVDFPRENLTVYIAEVEHIGGISLKALQREIGVQRSGSEPLLAGGEFVLPGTESSLDRSRNSKAEAAIVRLRDALIDTSISEEYARRIIDQRLSVQISATEPIVFYDEPAQYFQLPRSFVVLTPTVSMSNDLSDLIVTLQVTEFVRNDSEKIRGTGFYHAYSFVHPLSEPTADDDRTSYSDAWIALGQDRIRDLIYYGMDVTIQATQTHIIEGDLIASESARYIVPDYSKRRPLQLWRSTERDRWLFGGTFDNQVLIVAKDDAEQL